MTRLRDRPTDLPTPHGVGAPDTGASERTLPTRWSTQAPEPIGVLSSRRAHPMVLGFLRTDLCVPRHRELARAVSDAHEQAIRAVAEKERWRLAGTLRLQSPTGDQGDDPIEYLLAQLRTRSVDAVAVPERLHLRDGWGHDCLESVRQMCCVVTVSPKQLWPCTAEPPDLDRRGAERGVRR